MCRKDFLDNEILFHEKLKNFCDRTIIVRLPSSTLSQTIFPTAENTNSTTNKYSKKLPFY